MIIVLEEEIGTTELVEEVIEYYEVADFDVPDGITETVFTAEGDLLVGTGSATYMAKSVGVDGQFLKADSAEPGGVMWDDLPASDTTISMTNNGSDVELGDVVILDMSLDSGVKMTTRERDFRVCAVAAEGVANGAAGNFYQNGKHVVKVTGTIARGEWLITSTTSGRAKGSGSFTKPSEGGLGIALEANPSGTASIDVLLLVDTLVGLEAGNMYCAYGYSTTYVADCEQYTPDTWTSKTNGPAPTRVNAAGAAIGSSIYICYGTSGSALKDCEQYTPDTWTSKTDGPTPTRWGVAASTIDTKLYVCGGYDGSYYRDCDEYSPDTWTSKTDMPTPTRAYPSQATIGTNLYVCYGQNGPYYRDCDQYTPDTWTSKTDGPTPSREGTAAATIGTKLYVCGGTDGSYYRDCDEYNPDTWTSKTDMPTPARTVHQTTNIGSALYAAYGTTGSVIADCDEYLPDTWTSKTDGAAPARRGPSGGAV